MSNIDALINFNVHVSPSLSTVEVQEIDSTSCRAQADFCTVFKVQVRFLLLVLLFCSARTLYTQIVRGFARRIGYSVISAKFQDKDDCRLNG